MKSEKEVYAVLDEINIEVDSAGSVCQTVKMA